MPPHTAAIHRDLADTAGDDNIRARRNALIAHWAADRLHLSGWEIAAYAEMLHAVDHEEPGDADILRQLKADFAERGVAIDDRELESALKTCHKQALRETWSTD
ncbi:hypothetical protein M2360_004872 [Rhizobium sp. SG_E_25_P2]|jgi:hypothetical protein|uniref:ATPase inhibitor subunit zeta n=1 Tax=Rhizobium sp. SG_E_25_P2 TaxID=2879942 RepID=UPI002474DB19|nr:ATPase inhibitor subunit zeta [Rhizobium sp. SG_E_25_P2]MDH6269444.1 hypothetical protein [Rhizobium sp. SG_E_25_P2]